MTVYDNLLDSLSREFDILKQLKTNSRGSVSVVRHKKNGTQYIFRHFEGNGEVYRKLLPISSPHLPQIMEVAEQNGKVIVLEEFIQGDTLHYLLEGTLLPPSQAKKILLQLCSALWVFHSLGAVHRDIKPENVIIRGDTAVLIDFDASRIFKTENSSDTQILGTTGFAAPEQYGISQSDERADLYALGVLLNIMLTGKHPSIELAAGRMGRIVQRCTMTNPKKRFKNVLHLMEML